MRPPVSYCGETSWTSRSQWSSESPSALTFTVNGSIFRYGSFLNALLWFLLIAAVVFFLIVKPVNTFMKRYRPELSTDEPIRECPECLSAIPAAAKRCVFCTAELR